MRPAFATFVCAVAVGSFVADFRFPDLQGAGIVIALVPELIAAGSDVLDLVLLEFFGVFLLPVVSLLVCVGLGLLLTLRLPRHPVGWLLLLAGTFFQLAFAAQAYAWAGGHPVSPTPRALRALHRSRWRIRSRSADRSRRWLGTCPLSASSCT